MASSPSTRELGFKLVSHIMEVEEFILARYEDERVLAMTDDRPT